MKREDRLYGCGCKGGNATVAPATTTTTTAQPTNATVPVVQLTVNS
jgi:hypothetical protein